MAIEQDVVGRPKPPDLKLVQEDLDEEDYNDQLAENPFSKTYDRVARVKEYDIGLLARQAKDHVRLALVSLPPLDRKTCHPVKHTIVCGETGLSSGLDSRACRRRLFYFSDERVASSLGLFGKALFEAIGKQHADIVCFNELAFPATENGPSPKAIDYLRKVAKDSGTLIIGGSFHDSRTLYNSGQIFYPPDPDPAVSKDDLFYHKQVSAIATTEYVSIPCLRSTTMVRAFELRIAVLICLDMADYSAVASLFTHGNDVDLLLVPSYSPWTEDPLEKIATAVSSAMPGIVAIVNCYDRSGPSSMLYRFGVKQGEPELPRHWLPDRDTGVVATYDIDMSQFRDDKGLMAPQRDDHLKKLFDLRVALRR